jgi:uncharacterized protein with NRDE domain
MCLILFSYQPDSDTPLVLGANRDEFFARPTAPAQFWDDCPEVLAGRDLQAGGTWLGITRSGRFAAITNVREPNVVVNNPQSRGDLTRDFLSGSQSPQVYLDEIAGRQHAYAGFNLLVGEFSQTSSSLYYFSNREGEVKALRAGIYGLSNHLLDSAWPKVSDGKQGLSAIVAANLAVDSHRRIRALLENPRLAEDARLPKTGITYSREKALSATFITLPDYGTRATTVITIVDGQIYFSEQNYRAGSLEQPSRDGVLSTFTLAQPE